MLLAAMALQAYVALPPGIPLLTSHGLVPLRLRLANYFIVALVALGLYEYGFSLIESLGLGSIWMALGAYLILDTMNGVPPI